MTCSVYFQEGLIKNKGGVGLFQISQKEKLFISYDNQVLMRVISQCAPSSPFHFGQEDRIPGHLIERRSFPIPTLKVGIG